MLDKQKIAQHFDRISARRDSWADRNRLYHEQLIKVCHSFVNPDSRVLELGSSTGNVLAALNPKVGVGVDFSAESIALSQKKYSHLTWIHADVEMLPSHPALTAPFDLIIMEDLVGYLWDVEQFLKNIKHLTHPSTRLVVSCWNWMWEPILRFGEKLGLKAPNLDVHENWLSPSMLTNLLELSGYEVVMRQPGILIPYRVPILTDALNSLSYAPLLNAFVLSTILVARSLPKPEISDVSVSVIIPTRNEAGNIAALVERLPAMGKHTEVVFVDGDSTDGTVEEIHRQIAAHAERDIKFVPQVDQSKALSTSPDLMLKLGKGDAVRKGFAVATGEILMILDGDISVMPEDLPKFYEALVGSKARFANGTRFVYQHENEAMRGLNRIGNVFFSLLFTWLLGQRITDTLCGTKALFKRDYEAIVANRKRFGDFDPFGDFDLLFGAAWLQHRIADVPVRYRARTYGKSKVRVSQHGPLLGRMSLIALWHFKIKPMLGLQRPTSPKAQPQGVPKPLTSVITVILIIGAVAAALSRLRQKA